MSAARAISVLTPEHVPISLVPAGLGSRFCALLLDSALALSIATFASILLALVLPDEIAAAAVLTASFVILTGYHVLFDVRYEGRSPGKRAIGLRVVDIRGLPVTAQQSVIRSVVRSLDFLPFGYGLGAIAALVDPHGRRLGDLVAGTLVVDERRGLLREARLAPSRRYNSLRTPRVLRMVRHRLGLEERDFLVTLCVRADRMEPRARVQLMEETAAALRSWLDVDDPSLSGEALVRDVTSLATGDR